MRVGNYCPEQVESQKFIFLWIRGSVDLKQMFPQYRSDVYNGNTMERHSKDYWKPDGMMGAPECTGAEGLNQATILPGAEKPGGATGMGTRKQAVTCISRFAESLFKKKNVNIHLTNLKLSLLSTPCCLYQDYS